MYKYEHLMFFNLRPRWWFHYDCLDRLISLCRCCCSIYSQRVIACAVLESLSFLARTGQQQPYRKRSKKGKLFPIVDVLCCWFWVNYSERFYRLKPIHNDEEGDNLDVTL